MHIESVIVGIAISSYCLGTYLHAVDSNPLESIEIFLPRNHVSDRLAGTRLLLSGAIEWDFAYDSISQTHMTVE